MIRSDIRAQSAYHVPDSRGLIKLDAMENPYPLPAALRQAWAKRIAATDINRYPDAEMDKLRLLIAAHEGVDANQVLIGNGSDEIIQMLLIAVDAGTCVTPAPTFVMYELISRWLKRPVSTVPLNDDFSLDADLFLKICGREKAEIAFLACPNNPTGNLWPEATINKIADNFKGLLVIDEAYGPFAERTHTRLIRSNVMVLRTFSKLGWAGLRLGYLLGEASAIEQLNKVRLPYNINSLTQASAEFLFEHFEVFEKQAADIRAERSRMMVPLMEMDGLEVYPSQTNFILLKAPHAENIFKQLLASGILIKCMHASGGLLKNCLRITIGSKEENDAVIAALREILS